jgi:predicted phosphodiesterase
MKFVAISDTHGKHQKLVLPKGDVIIHAGDVSSKGQENEVIDFLKWFSNLDFEYKIFIAGN